MHNNNNHNFKIEERRRKVASLIAQSMIESEIAEQLCVDQSTISRDVKAIKEMSQQFVFDLAKSDLAYYYKQCINGIEEVRRRVCPDSLTPKDSFKIYHTENSSDNGCDHNFDNKIVEEHLEFFDTSSAQPIISSPTSLSLRSQEALPDGLRYVNKEYRDRKFFALNRSFLHVPPLLRILGKEIGLKDYGRVEKTRRILLKTMHFWHKKTSIITPRMIHSIYWHLDSLEDLSGITKVAEYLVDRISADYPDKDLEKIRKKMK